jgi:ribosomal protein S18 acetylase RimI-like enzyme
VLPASYAPLRSVKCGPGECRSEHEVHGMTRAYARGKRQAEVFRITAVGGGPLIGYAAFLAAAFPPDKPALAQINGFPYIDLISLSEKFRGLRKSGQRLGDLVLEDALESIANRGQWGPGPDVFALIDPRNDPSCKLFKRHGFQVLMEPPEDDFENDSLFWRPATA